ncbi:serine/threonine protein kinase [Haloferula sargassicola]|uniref:Serine/threonine-protein kinase PknD n=1 Tax=Haloferula sargassicola TaxID=490096 RepID=A0ABP9UT47_9BACT
MSRRGKTGELAPEEVVEDRHSIENAVFGAAMEIPDRAQRAEFLDRVFHDDPAGRADMEELLAMAGRSSAYFLEGKRRTAMLARDLIGELPDPPPEIPEPPAAEKEGTRIGRYELLRKIGEGGCGEIFEAAQDGMRRTVALKIIRRGMDTASVVSRFEAERHALEIMEHPNIARVLDAGSTPGGRPYFVMELVRGPRITTLCETERLGIRQRLGLFLEVCQAIQHAHQKGIVHRDIKPSNILVESLDGHFVPKVIDFGIAKAMDAGCGRGDITLTDQLLGTPAYMSPEQIEMSGGDIDTRTDIYSLGALLYELLAGCPPFDTGKLMESGYSEMRRTLLEVNPPLPSMSVISGGNGASLPEPKERWAAGLRGDLDWIVCKAMEKERNRRYLTVNSLSMDIQRHLDNQPVLARKPSRRYYLRKFIRRNRIACALGASMLLSLIGGLGTATALYFREKEVLAEQAKLKRHAQARANVSRAAILLSEGKTEQADQLLRADPLESIEASPEAAEVFRSLGRWNAVFGRWEQAAHCFRLMNEANRLGDRTRVVEGVDLLMTAPAYLEAGDLRAYLRFRADVLERYVPAENALQAEHLLKVCLLLPVDAFVLERLESTLEKCRGKAPTAAGTMPFPEWNALSRSLYHYRAGDFQKAIVAANESIAVDDPPGSRVATARLLRGMSRSGLGRSDEAADDIRQAREALRRVESQVDESGFPSIGTWFSWSVLRVLLREAEATTGL